MANNYYDATGVLMLNRITPVITALFGAFELDETSVSYTHLTLPTKA